MAITARAEGTWAEYTADGTVAVPAAQLTGDLMLLLASWKDYVHTATVSGWTEITEFADGTNSKGNGTGSMKVGAWYKVATSDTEADPTLDWTTLGANDIAGAVIIVFQKGATDDWSTPAFATAAMTNWTTTSQVVTASSDPGITAGDLVIGLIGVRDNSATYTRGATTGIAATGITWTGNYVEYPATHFDTTTGFDMSADAGYRIASSGTASAAPTMEGTISAAETGAALWVRLRVFTGTTVNAGVATATGAANAVTTLLTANLGVATATGLANNATVQTGGGPSGPTSRTFNGTSDYANNASAVTTTTPLTLVAWVKRGTLSANGYVCAINQTTFYHGFTLGVSPTGQALATQQGTWGGGDPDTFTTATFPTGEWHHIAGTFSSSSSRAVFLDGANKVTNAEPITMNTPTQTTVGRHPAPSNYFNGSVAHAAVYGVVLSDPEVADLAAGALPSTVQPGNLLAYWPLAGDASPEPDDASTFDLTLTGTTKGADGPSVGRVPRFAPYPQLLAH